MVATHERFLSCLGIRDIDLSESTACGADALSSILGFIGIQQIEK